jgi:ribosomal protein S27AE
MTEPTRRDCPSCGGSSLAEILHWPSLPVNAALFPVTRAESLSIPRGSLRLTVCERCGLVFNADHDGSLVEYSPRCIETQAGSPRGRAFADARAQGGVERHGLAGGDVVEVGCGPDATFLRALCRLTGGRGIGIDPACTPGKDGTLMLLAEALGPQHVDLSGRALVCRHTLEHVPDVGAFLDLVRAWSEANDDAPVLLELPDAERIFRETAFWDVYYAHCSYFTGESLGASLQLAGLASVEVRLAFEGQYLLAEGRAGGSGRNTEVGASATVAAAKEFGRSATRRIDRARDALRRLASHGRVVLWQAGGKALAVLTLTGIGDEITGVVDGNPAKRGLFLPGTDREILGPSDMAAVRPVNVVVMNVVYVDEVARTLAESGVEASVRSFESLL